MHAGVGAVLGIIAGGSIGFFVIDSVSDGIPGQDELQTAAIQVSNRAVQSAQPAPSLRPVVVDEGRDGNPFPCYGWEPTDEVIAAMEISEAAGEAVRAAYADSKKRIWTAFAEPCSTTLGVESLVVIERMGLAPCFELVRAQADAETARRLGGALTAEYSRFMRRLSDGIGDVQAERLAAAGRLCLDTHLLRHVPAR